MVQIIALTLLAFGCAHHELPSSSVWPTQQQLAEFTDRALAALRSHEGVRLRSGRVVPGVGEYDATKPIRYWCEPGKTSKVFIHIPTKSQRSNTYI